MTVLSRLTKLGMAKQDDPTTYKVPTVSVPWNTAKYMDQIDPLRDESVRANDNVLNSIAQGASQSVWELDVNGYADFIGHFFAAMGLFDTVTPGVSTTLAAGGAPGDNSIQVNATIPSGSVIQVGTGATLEYHQTGSPSGSGPYVLPLADGPLLHTQNVGVVVASQATHTFAQDRTFTTVWPAYSFTTNDGVDQLGWAGCVASEIVLKIDPKGLITISPKFAGYQSAVEADFAYAASTALPIAGWGWTVNNAGGASTRGLTMDVTFKRAQELIHSSTGQASPREIFAGALEVDGAYKAIFENDTDVNLFRKAIQTPTTHTLVQPVPFGGASLAVTMSKSGYTTGEVVNSGVYLQLDQAVSGIFNTTDGGAVTAVLKNFATPAY